MDAKRIAVLRGGWSSEREISLNSGVAIVNALKSRSYDVIDIVVERNLTKLINALEPKPDVVYNTLHGIGGEDGAIQGVLEILDIPQVQSGVMASAIAMDKGTSLLLFKQVGLPIPEGVLITQKELLENPPYKPPFVAKYPKEGSSVGVYIVKNNNNALDELKPDNTPILVEKFIEGREFSIPVLYGKALPIVEIIAEDGTYDFVAKYSDQSKTEYQCPADLPNSITKKMQGYAEQAHKVLGCKGLTRTDFMMDKQGNIFTLEINTQPGMTNHSLAPLSASKIGMDFADLVEAVIKGA